MDFIIDKKDFPHIIVIMNESFGSVHERVMTNIEVTPYFNSLKNVIKGFLYVNTFGGGTSNTEFEFLTNMTVGNFNYPVFPYNNFVKKDKYSLAKYFKSLDYETIAMHPYTATNYHRDVVYKYFGFDKLYFYDDFRDKKYVRKFVSDESMYEEVIRRFEENDNKKFIFGITMQNHSGYQKFNEEKVYVIDNDDYSKINYESLNSYLSLMKISDNAIKILIDYFSKVKERVLICFFGDHNASFGTRLNKKYYYNGFYYEGSNVYKTPFFIYDNKILNDEFIDCISDNLLSTVLLKKAHLPLDEHQTKISKLYDMVEYMNYHKLKIRNVDELLLFDEVENHINIDSNTKKTISDYLKMQKEYLFN